MVCLVSILVQFVRRFVVIIYHRSLNITEPLQLATKMAVKPTFGHLDEFNPNAESVTVYLERADLFLAANDVPDEKKVSVFLSSVGKTTYALLRDSLQPQAPTDKSLTEIKTALKKHYQPTPSVMVERFKFHKRSQKEGESVAEYVAELKRLSTHCQFEAYLDDALRDRLVCGLRKESTQKRLLLEERLTFTKAVEVAQSIESVDKQTLAMKSDMSEQSKVYSTSRFILWSMHQVW